MKLVWWLFFFLLFFGLVSYVSFSSVSEGFESKPRCPNLLVQKGPKYYLYNTKLENVPGVNPIVFDTLEDYTQFLEWQRHVGIRCPVLYLQHTETPQGDEVYRIRPSVTEVQPGIPNMPVPKPYVGPPPPTSQSELANPSSLPPPPPPPKSTSTAISTSATASSMPTLAPPPSLPEYHDPVFEKILPTEDTIQVKKLSDFPNNATGVASINGISPNPMDPNWGGATFAQGLVDSGYYEGDQVQIAIA